LAVANLNSSSVSVLLGKGDGTFRGRANYFVETLPRSVAIGDLNGDGTPDLAVANQGTKSVSVLLGNGDGTFSYWPSYPTVNAPNSVAIGDLNGDGYADLATANADSSTVSVLLGNGDATFGATSLLEAGWQPASVAIGDLNGDGKRDLAVAVWGANPSYSGTVSVLLGNGDGTLGAKSDYGGGGGSSSVVIGDFNGDGRLDLAAANALSVGVGVLLGNGDGTFGAPTYYGTSPFPNFVAMGDLNGDGTPDLATANFSGTVSVLGNTPASLSGVSEQSVHELWLAQSRPNPARSQALIRFTLPSAGPVTLAVYDLQGRRVASLLDHAPQSAGPHDLPVCTAGWRAGCYFYRLDAVGVKLTRKMAVLP
jgi:hypothetical protein